MKKLFVLIFVLAEFAGNKQLLAQNQFYLEISPAYGFPASCAFLGFSEIYTEDGSYQQEAINGSLGAGFSVSLGAGYNFCRNVGGQLRLSYLSGNEYKNDVIYQYFGTNYTSHRKEKATAFLAEPMLNFFTDQADKKVNYYARIGIILPLNTKSKLTSDEQFGEDSSGINTTHAVLEKNGALKVGFTGSAGIILSVAEHVGLFGEAYYRGLSIPWKSGSVIEYNEVFTDASGTVTTTLDDLEVSEKEFEYKDTVTQEDNKDPDQPAVLLQQFSPFSSAGFAVGLRFTF